MSGERVIFAGPSINGLDGLPLEEVTILPPCKQGDIYLATLSEPSAIGIIDGYFEGAPSVWHKEILYAMSVGIHVTGASSMGALRAAELDTYGMRGIGRIYQMYRDLVIEDDDEVALLHGPDELGSPPLSVPMVNVRSTIERALNEGVLDQSAGDRLITCAKEMFYKERNWDTVLRRLREDEALPTAFGKFRDWVLDGQVDQKAKDARELFNIMASEDFSVAFEAEFEFEVTEFWFQNTVKWRKRVENVPETTAEKSGAGYKLFS